LGCMNKTDQIIINYGTNKPWKKLFYHFTGLAILKCSDNPHILVVWSVGYFVMLFHIQRSFSTTDLKMWISITMSRSMWQHHNCLDIGTFCKSQVCMFH
jgi:hypothetical protein